jgi:hypothetical protein
LVAVTRDRDVVGPDFRSTSRHGSWRGGALTVAATAAAGAPFETIVPTATITAAAVELMPPMIRGSSLGVTRRPQLRPESAFQPEDADEGRPGSPVQHVRDRRVGDLGALCDIPQRLVSDCVSETPGELLGSLDSRIVSHAIASPSAAHKKSGRRFVETHRARHGKSVGGPTVLLSPVVTPARHTWCLLTPSQLPGGVPGREELPPAVRRHISPRRLIVASHLSGARSDAGERPVEPGVVCSGAGAWQPAYGPVGGTR